MYRKSKRSSKKADGGSVVKFIDSPEDNGEKKVENVGRSIRGTELVSRHVGGPDVVSHDKNAGDCDLMDNLGLNRRRGEGWTTTADNQIGSTAAVMVDGDMLAEKIAAERTTTVREGGKEPTGQSKKLNNRAIVQVLDSVDTPQSHFVSENCDDSGGNRPSVVEPTTAFSVLPDVAGDGGQHCNCPSCHENSSRTSSSKLHHPINIKRFYLLLVNFLFFFFFKQVGIEQILLKLYHLIKINKNKFHNKARKFKMIKFLMFMHSVTDVLERE